jgi:hypothetical protein
MVIFSHQREDLEVESRTHLLVCNWPHSVWTKSLVCKDAFQQGFHYSEVLQMILHCLQVRDFGSLPAVWTACHPVRTLICP